EDIAQDQSEMANVSETEHKKLSNQLREHEFIKIQEAIKNCHGNRKLMAEELGVSERTLRYKLAKMRENCKTEMEAV
ncbi:helix-turn-helix domain-containing protein, partial [Acinetobacter baumannii]